MGNLIRDIMKTIRINIRSILLFEFVYRLVFVVFYGRIVNYFLGLLLRSSGYSYLTIKNCKDCLLNPITYPILLLLVFVSVLFAGFETAILSSGFRAASMGQELRVAPMLVRGSKGFLRMFRLRNFPMLFFQGITFYMLQSFILYKLINTSKQATDLKRILTDIHVIPIILSIVFLVLLGYILIHIFSFYECYYAGLSYKAAMKSGRRFWKGKVLKVAPLYAFGTILYIMLYYVVYSILIVVVSCFVVLFAKDFLEMALIEVISDYLNNMLMYFLSIFCMVVYMGITIGTYYYYHPERIRKESDTLGYGNTEWKKKTVLTVVILILFGTVMNIYDVARNGNLRFENTFGRIMITSHRGYSSVAPENTIPSLELAIEGLADYAEIDIRQSRDGVIVLIHDANLSRTTGENDYVWNFDYDELYQLDAGSFFSREFAGSYIPTLDEVLDLCKGKIKLNIEVKKSSRDQYFIPQLIAMIEEKDMEEQCIFSSTSYQYLKEIKGCNPKLYTGYIIPAAYGDYFNDENIDFFSVNSSYLTQRSVDMAHSYGKGIHAWTVNDRQELNRMQRIGVDSIITDEPIYAREVLYGNENTQSLVAYIKMLLD